MSAAAAGILVITAAVVVAYHRVILDGLALSGYDVQTYFFPLRSYASRVLLSGDFPLWNPYLFMGAPFFANPQTAVLYPLNLALLPMDAARAVSVSVIFHVWIAALGGLLFGRRVLGLRWPAATVAALAFGLGGTLSGQSGHPNQVAVIAWVPYVMWMVNGLSGPRYRWAALGLSVLFAIQILAGHPQQVYISTVIATAYLIFALYLGKRAGTVATVREAGARIGLYAAALGLGTLLAAVQIFPTLLLSSLSIRSAGLPLHEAASFSLSGRELGSALFPSFAHAPSSQEFLAFVGFTGIWLAALGVFAPLRRPHALFFAAAAVVGLVLAVGPATPLFRGAHALLPGFDLFRVPARWLLGFNLSLALLAGMGLDYVLTRGPGWSTRTIFALGTALLTVVAAVAISLGTNSGLPMRVPLLWGASAAATLLFLGAWLLRPRPLAALAPAVIALELILAQRPLELAKPIPIEAYSDPGPVVSLLPTDPGAPRTLGLADPSYEINDDDRAILASRYQEELGFPTFIQFLVGLKYRDTISPNLSLGYLLSSPDGYDGGVLPTRDYIQLKDAILPGAALEADALLRNQIEGLPDRRVLDLLGTGYLIVDRKADIELGRIFFDMEIEVDIGAGRGIVLPLPDDINIGQIWMIAEVSSPAAADAVQDVGWLDVIDAAGTATTSRISMGEILPNSNRAADLGDSMATDLSATAYATSKVLDRPVVGGAVRIRAAPGADLGIRAITLVSESNEVIPVPLRTHDPLRLIHWRDVKVYEVPNPIPAAFVVGSFAVADSPEAAALAIRMRGFEPSQMVILEREFRDRSPSRTVLGWFGDRLRDAGLRGPRARTGSLDTEYVSALEDVSVERDSSSLGIPAFDLAENGRDAIVRIRRFEAERIEVQTESDRTSILVISDSIYPGWRARIDGIETPLLRANLLFKAVVVPAGTHDIDVTYEPSAFRAGAFISIIAWGALAAGLAMVGIRKLRRTRSP